MDTLKELFENLIFEKDENGNPLLIKIIFGDARKKSQPCKKVVLRPLSINGELKYQAESFVSNKASHENLTGEEAVQLSLNLTIKDFKQINCFTQNKEIQILASKPNNPRIIEKQAILRCADDRLSHNKNKNYIIPDHEPCDFLIRLGVMDMTGKVLQKHYSKFRQINRYLEIVEDVIDFLPQKGACCTHPLKIIDFGCGKAYLTFALYHYLKVMKGRNVEIIGLDLKADVIEFCNQVATDLHYDDLKFLMGDIADYTNDHADMVVTLHACDTATDYALINAVKWHTKVILSVPCCQHEMFSQIKNDLHQPMYKHGILKDRFTELLTDGLRGLKLEANGYDVSMIEFTTLEHTSKNIMIRAIQNDICLNGERSKKAAEEYSRLKEFYQVSPTIDLL